MAYNVLVVDDSAVMRTMVVRTLRLSRIPLGEVVEVASGEEALRVVETRWVHLATVDLNMPGMDGEALIQTIRANPEWSSLPIIVISSEVNDKRIERVKAQGVAFIKKPFAPETLRKTIQSLMGDSYTDEPRQSIVSSGDLDF